MEVSRNLECPKCPYSTQDMHDLKQHLKVHAANLEELYELIDLTLVTLGIHIRL